ncbi:MAG: hypothetical protein FWF42_03515 [Streptococcaceae bacterium]|nr:hypothetical protein [Streptococcaceae bacterium]MCL2681207.1 hypothetical protein [Streptococcaceae bacterium]MCL2858739.1 hypothetical protein [Streptococcaceae bacterium]
MVFIIILSIICCLWYFLKFLAHYWKRARQWVNKLTPYTKFIHAWAYSAPATFVYTAIFTVLAIIQKTTSTRLISIITRANSTNITKMDQQPISVLFNSAFWVADQAAGLVIYILLFITFVAWAERKYGTPRLILIGISGHVLGSLLMIAVEVWAINNGHAPASLANTTDVGVSYVLVACCSAAILLMRRWWLVFGILSFLAFIIGPFVVGRSIWNLGHFFASITGFIIAFVLLKLIPLREVRSPLDEFRHTRESWTQLLK